MFAKYFLHFTASKITEKVELGMAMLVGDDSGATLLTDFDLKVEIFLLS